MNKLWLRASIRSTLSTLALLGFVHCTGQANQESPHDEVGLFDAQSAMQVDVTLKRTKDEEIPYHPTDEFWNVDDDGKRMEAIVRKSEEGD